MSKFYCFSVFYQTTQVVKHRLSEPLVGVEVNKANNQGNTPLYIAAYRGHADVVGLLLAVEGVEVNKADQDGLTPL